MWPPTETPGRAAALLDEGRALLRQGRSAEALLRFEAACQTDPACAQARLEAFTDAITEAWADPQDLQGPAFSLIRLDERIARCVGVANDSWPARPSRAALFGSDGLAALSDNRLLHALLEAAPVRSVRFERFLTCARRALLDIATSEQPPDTTEAAALGFHAALARQCFINEYVFDCAADESHAAAACRTRLLKLLAAGAAPPPLLLLAVAAYFPLHQLADARRLLAHGAAGALAELLRQQVREPLEEQALRTGIGSLTAIAGGVSAAVRQQYEENPYPRWVKMPRREQPLTFNTELRNALPFARFAPLSDDRAPQALVAGCGTGSDAILVAQRFRGVQVLAIDLSLSSLAYAKRKSLELGVTNVEYAHADILRLGGLERSFDIIGAVGVLHHLSDPFAGWRVLLSRLRPGGFMCLGLYSEIGRQPVLKAREFIAAHGFENTPQGVRRFRQTVLTGEVDGAVRSLSNSRAFYSLSDCRDLAFHVQEQPVRLAQIESFLGELGLQFIGFELDLRVLNQYRGRFPDDPCCTNLSNWSRFETDHPLTFTAMYRFWIRN